MLQGACEDNTLSLPLRQSLVHSLLCTNHFPIFSYGLHALLQDCIVCLRRDHAKEIAMAFISRADLHTPICTALYRLCTQNRDVLKV